MGEQDFNGYAEVYRAVFRVHVISARSKQTTGRRPQRFLSPRNAIQFFRATLTSSTLPYSLEGRRLVSNAPPLTGRLRSAQITLIVASASHDIWWTYAAKGTRDLEAMNSFPSFFLYDEEAHFRNMIVGLYTLYDSYAETLTIKSLIRELDPQAAKPIWRRYNAVQDAVKKVTYLRHNAFAHRAAGKDYRGIFEEAGLRPDDLKALITGSLDLLGMIADAIGAEPMLLPSLTYETTRLLNRIKTADTA